MAVLLGRDDRPGTASPARLGLAFLVVMALAPVRAAAPAEPPPVPEEPAVEETAAEEPPPEAPPVPEEPGAEEPVVQLPTAPLPTAERPVVEEPGAELSLADEPVFAQGRVRLFPNDDLSAPYLADPHRPTNSAAVQFQTKSAVAAASGVRSWLAAGGRFGVVRRVPRDGRGRSWQLGIEAGLDAQFDSERKLDNIGYDGNYGFTLTTKGQGPLVLKVAAFHTSAHVGDEWAANTGRERIGYTREELSFGASGPVGGTARLYGEMAYAYKQLSPDVQRPWRFQGGIERESRRALAQGRLGWYAAADFQFWQERDFRLDLTAEAGFLAYSGTRRWRVGARYSNGRVPLGEFFQDTESWFTLGLWVDF